MNASNRSQKHEEARNTLPEDLKPVFDEIVEDYKFATFKRYGNGYVAYTVLADLVRVGWRHAGTQREVLTHPERVILTHPGR
jgi:hypothetical protein